MSEGVIEAVKRAVVKALRPVMRSVRIPGGARPHVDLEYPMIETEYPAVWVQFSIRSLRVSGLGHQWTAPEGELIQEWMYEGDVSLTIVALTSIERDRIADALISHFAFARASGAGSSQPSLYRELAENPQVSIVINSDELGSGGQSTNLGVPWDHEQLAYEDTYRFSVLGEFQSIHDPGTGVTRLRAIEVAPELEIPKVGPQPGEWI